MKRWQIDGGMGVNSRTMWLIGLREWLYYNKGKWMNGEETWTEENLNRILNDNSQEPYSYVVKQIYISMFSFRNNGRGNKFGERVLITNVEEL